MVQQHVVVDGSNIATEGRSMPSLRQLDEAVTAFLEEHGDVELTVVVDATFGHRISDDDKAEYEEAILNGELVTPPAGAIGRGDAFVLQIADKAGASVFSNDSFQEFHGTYDWLFDEGRLVGGKPVRNVGWVFVLRTPVRGPTSRRATREARSPVKPAAKRTASSRQRTLVDPDPTPPAIGTSAVVDETGKVVRRPTTSRRKKVAEPVAPAATAVADPLDDEASPGRARRRRTTAKGTDPINDPLPFLEFVGSHPVGSSVEGVVDRFSSHGAYVMIDGAHCYVPLKAMGDPPPTSAREVMQVGEIRAFVVHSFDSPRRGIDLALPGDGATLVRAAPVAASEVPDDDTTPAEDQDVPQEQPDDVPDDQWITMVETAAGSPAQEAPATAPRKATAKRAAKKATTAAKKAAPTTARRATTAKKVTTAKEATATKKATATSVGADGPAQEPSPRTKVTSRKRAPTTTAPERSVIAEAPSADSDAVAATPTAKKATAKKATTKATAKKATAKKVTAKKATAKKARAKKTSATEPAVPPDVQH